MRLKISEIAKQLGLSLLEQTDCVVEGAAIDSRAVKHGNLFICLPGSKVDGHDFAETAAKVGASAILASRSLPALKIPVLVVPDVEKAMAKLASFCRSRTTAKVLCLTGTAGKTTLKDTISAIMCQKGSVAATQGNHNNQIGLPLTMLNANEHDDFWILEAGISHAGDMDLLGGIARPDIAVILNVGPGHTEGLGDRGVVWHKARLLQYVQPGHGRALVNADYPELVEACAVYEIQPEFFSCVKDADCQYRLLDCGPGWLEMLLNGRQVHFCTPFMGTFGAEIGVAAAASTKMLGASDAEIAAGFESVKLPEQRYQQIVLPDNVVLVDDTYNANPLSMSRALECAAQEARRRHLSFYAVLGAMGELGSVAEASHRSLGRQLADLQPEGVFWTGQWGDAVADAMGVASLPVLETAADLVELWQSRNLPQHDMLIIFKGSRANYLERYVQAFRQMIIKGAEAVHVL